MAMSPSERIYLLSKWIKPSSDNEQLQRQRAERMVRNATGAPQPADTVHGQRVRADPEQFTGIEVVEQQCGGFDPDTDSPAAEDLRGEDLPTGQRDEPPQRSTSTSSASVSASTGGNGEGPAGVAPSATSLAGSLTVR